MSVPKGVKVGSAFIDITPVMDQAALARQLEKFEVEVKKQYKRASDITQAYARLRVELEKWVTDQYGQHAKGRLAITEETLKAQKALKKSESEAILRALEMTERAEQASEKRRVAAKEAATRRKERIALNARDLEIKYGAQVAADYEAQLKAMQAGKKKLTLTQINETKRWAELEQSEIRRVAAADREANREAVRQAQYTAAKRTEAAKSASEAYKSSFATVREQTLRTMQLEQMRDRARLEGELAVRTAMAETAAAQLSTARTSLSRLATEGTATTRTLSGAFDAVGKNVKRTGEHVERLGTTAHETGGLLARMVTPLAAVGAGLTAWGLKAADNFQNAQTSLKSMRLELKDANELLNNLTKYGLKTPYSVGDMLTYGTRFARAIGAHDDDFNSADPKRHQKGSAQVSEKAQNVVQMIGDLAARGGISDSSMVQRGYYAMEKLMDADRVSLRDTKQLEYAINMPVQELAHLLGFSDKKYTQNEVDGFSAVNPGFHAKAGDKYAASAQMMEVMANAKLTGGVRGEDLVHGLLNYWEGNKTGVPGINQDTTLKGSAERLGQATFSSRISNMKETAQQNLRGMFQHYNKKTGELEYTGLGETLMGKKIEYRGKDKQMHTRWEGGVLNDVNSVTSSLLGKNGNGPVPKLMTGFVEGLKSFVKQLKTWSKMLAEHPEIMKAVNSIGKTIVKVAPILLGVGVMLKLLGGAIKMLSPVVSVLKGVTKGGVGLWKVGNQVARGIQNKATGGSYRAGYRAQYGAYNGGDTRSIGQRARDGIVGRGAEEETLRLNISQYQQEMNKAKAEADEFKQKIRDLNRQNLGRLAEEAAGKDSSVQAALGKAEKAAEKAKQATDRLNGAKLKALKGQFSNSTTAAHNLGSATNTVASNVGSLNGHRLKDLRDWFKKVSKAAEDAHTKASDLSAKVGELNRKGTNKVVGEINDLKDSLSRAKDQAALLEGLLQKIANHQSSGSSKGKGKGKGPNTKKATGGILPGYTPGRDVHSFHSETAGTLELSGGEAVMRPEWTAAVGTGFVDRMNRAAREGGVGGVRKAMKFASGGVLGKLGMNKLVDAARQFNIAPDVSAAFSTMAMDSAARPLGGNLLSGVVGAGTSGSHFIGGDLSEKFKDMYSFMSRDSWDILKKLPIPDGYSELIGWIGGIMGPISGEYFWDDVWKGNGNILQRGAAYLGDMFSTKTVGKIVENTFGGLWDAVKAVYSGGKAALTDPVGFMTDGISGMWDLTVAEYDGIVDMVKSLKQMYTSPAEYAGQVLGDVKQSAEDALPNTKGLFDFSGTHLKLKRPDFSKAAESQISTPGKGSAVSRWTPQAKMALAQLGLPASALDLVLHRIQVESGGNPKAINNWDSNAKAGHPSQGLMQTIPGTFNAYAGPYKSRGITDPMASIYAGLNYAHSRYGSGWQKALSGTKGYWTGTKGAQKGWAWVGEKGPELVNFGGGETVLNHQDSVLAAGHVSRGYATGTGSTRTTGIAADAEKGVSTLNTAVKKLYEIISKAFTTGRIGSGTASGLNKWLDQENKQLQKLVKQRTDLAPKLKDANKKLADIQKNEAEMASSVSDQSKGLRSLSGIFNTNGVSVSSGLSSLHERLAAIKSFQSDITALTSKGYSKEIIAEIGQAGPEQGDAMAKELLKATKSQMTDYNKTYAAIGSASDSLGKSVASSYYAAGEKAAKALVDGLTKTDNGMKKQIEGLADTIVKTLKKKLNFNSKTPVDSGLASLLTWLTGQSQAVKGKPAKPKPKKSTHVTTHYSTDSKGRRVVTVTTTVYDPVKGTSTSTTERTVGGKTSKSSSTTKGYWTGTRSASPGIALVGERGPELVDFGKGGARVYDAKDTAGMMGPRYEIHIHEAKSENTTQSVLRAMKYAEVMSVM